MRSTVCRRRSATQSNPPIPLDNPGRRFYNHGGSFELTVGECKRMESASAMMEFEGGEDLGGLIDTKFVASLVADSLNKMKQRAPENNEAVNRLRRGADNLENDNLERALADCNAAIDIAPAFAQAYVARGLTYWKKGDFVRALADCNAAIQMDPNYAQPYFVRALVYLPQGRLDLSMADLSKAIELQHDFPRAYSTRAAVHRAKGDLNSALVDLSKAIELQPGYSLAYIYRAIAYQEKGDSDRAIADLDKAIKMLPDYPTAYRLRAEARRATDDLDSALADINKAVDLDIYDAQAFMLRGLIHKDRGEIADYEEEFRVAVLLDGELVNHETHGAEFARIKKADEEEEAKWEETFKLPESQIFLKKMAEEALEAHRQGKTKPLKLEDL